MIYNGGHYIVIHFIQYVYAIWNVIETIHIDYFINIITAWIEVNIVTIT